MNFYGGPYKQIVLRCKSFGFVVSIKILSKNSPIRSKKYLLFTSKYEIKNFYGGPHIGYLLIVKVKVALLYALFR
jgi:hypothetical protein